MATFSLRVKTAWPCLDSAVESLVWAISLLLCKKGLRNGLLAMWDLHLWQLKLFSWSMGSRSLRAIKLINEWVWFDSQIHTKWLQQRQLGDVLSVKTQGIHKLKATPKE